ncbi:hypothetical protein PSTG_02916 [Puccinia striiformis f. sp. tritici PST-78]|uniref:N-acetylglucosamine kinase n=1 Tax=Puccinia striiformis f. sp. tritici PST-78 TaxID=1165861 RepID=A0A0L0VX32_9BASI|nr:hypothetical protein PSTG_02916 [Puccinia striiformis f. sp. tritici PST-78]
MRESTFEKQDMDVYLCIDGGGTKTNVTISGRSRDTPDEVKILGKGTNQSSNYTGVGIEQAMRSIGDATITALQAIDANYTIVSRGWNYDGFQAQPELKTALKPAPFTKIWAGLSGMDGRSDYDILYKHLSLLFGLPSTDQETLKLTNDCDLLSSQIQLIHSQSDRPCKGGIVMIAGTGSIATAFRFDSSSILQSLGRIGGHGYLLGDHGSAYYVGLITIQEILSFFDRRHLSSSSSPITTTTTTTTAQSSLIDHINLYNQLISTSSLITPILNHFKIDKLDDLMSTIYMNTNDQARKIAISSISRIVMEAAFNEKQQDKFALQILERTAIKLSELVYEMILIYNLNPEGLVLCLGGGMWSIYPGFKELVLGIMKNQFDVSWGWVSIVDLPDRIGAISLASSS